MRRYLQYIICSVSVLSLLFATTSCEHKDLCYHHPHGVKIKVEFDWSKAPDANPAGMCVFFYPEDGGEAVRYDFKGREGGEIEIIVGNYRAIAYNNDTETVRYANGGFETHRLYTSETSVLEPLLGRDVDSKPLPEDAENDRVVRTPDMVWATSSEQISITETETHYDHEIITGEMSGPSLKVDNTGEVVVITFTPEEVVCHYSYEYQNVKNLRNVSKMSAALTGMSGVYYPGLWQLDKECITLPFEAQSFGKNSIIGNFLTFGHHLDKTQKHWMVLYTFLIDGRLMIYFTDVTGQVHNAPDPRHVHIIIPNLPIPDVDQDKGSFQPSVDEWEVENHEIRM